MKATLPAPLPLLAKELTEQSARPRTYVLRSLYMLAVFAVGLSMFLYRRGSWDERSFSMLGEGSRLFDAVLQFQWWANWIMLPLMTAGVITAEKERETLGLLLITKLRPLTIVLEKFLGRVVPMLLYQLSALPLLAVGYSLGGVEDGRVFVAAVALVLGVLQVGSLALVWSAWMRTTAQAMVATYVALISMLFLSDLLSNSIPTTSGSSPLHTTASSILVALSSRALERPEVLNSLGWFQALAAALCPVLMNLLIARMVLWKRAFLQARGFGIVLLQQLDRFFHAINHNPITRGVVLLKERVPLPGRQPVAWRETTKRALGTTRYLIRFLLVTEAPLIALLLWPMATGSVFSDREYLVGRWGIFAAWMIALFTIIVQSTGTIAGERARQTLDVLLSTPMTAAEIVTQKMAGVARMQKILLLPLGTALLFYAAYLMSIGNASAWEVEGWPLFRSFLQVGLYLPVVGWLGFYCGLWCRTQTQSMILCALIVATLVILPGWLTNLIDRPSPPYGIVIPMQQGGSFRLMNQQYYGTPPLLDYVFIAPVKILLPSFGNSHLRPHDPASSMIVFLLEIGHWIFVGLLLYGMRSRAPNALSRNTRRCESPILLEAAEPA